MSPTIYSFISLSQNDKRTDYQGKRIAEKVQYAWNVNYNKKINVVLGDEWSAGNLSYHLKSRPVWEGNVTQEKLDSYLHYVCIENICVGNR